MPEIVLDILKYLFLLLIFLFLARAVKAMYLEILGPRAERARPAQGRPQPRPRASSKPPDKVAVVAPDSPKAQIYDVGDELIVGRDAKCQIVIQDTYSSQFHARLFRRDGALFIEDMGSTNGTYLNRRKVTSPIQVSRGDKARIGKTELEFRR